MAGIQNTTIFSKGERLQASAAQDIAEMQTDATDVSRINHTGNPEGVVSANPSSLCHDPVSGIVYIKYSGTGNTGWNQIPNPFSPNSIIQDFNDFITGGGNLQGTPGSGLSAIAGTATNPGIITMYGGSSNGVAISSNTGSSPYPDPFKLGGGSLSLNWVFDLIALSNDTDAYTSYIGLLDFDDFNNQTPPVDGVYFQYTHNVNSGNWQIVCNKGGVSTVANTSTPAAIGFHNFGIIINAAGTSASFYINGIQVANSPVVSNLPINSISPIILSLVSAGALPVQQVDLVYYTQILTTKR